eukprot:CAMPEP_0178627106 /NCGR_PEP_ID=MMETSP0698-20121128/8740_1 /TAXON_ID=265572 /ORGANISM="Extubocellulus spinifer, Strain CCMP396" /LENGTH=433 /DNA_ID=CAMNT_0020266325 /DNA_START=121 /DNA_END=1422 /DNA_ORIENTATION=+
MAAQPPYTISQVEHTVEHVGRQKAASKRRIRWVFGVTPIAGTAAAPSTQQHELVFTWSISSGKQDITLDGTNVTFNRQKGRSVFNEALQRMGEKPDLRLVCTTTVPTGCPQDFVLYELLIDDMPYRCYPVGGLGVGRQEVYMGGAIGGIRPPGSILDITDPGKYDGCGSPDYVPGGAGGGAPPALLAPGADAGAMDISGGGEAEHHVGFATASAGDDLASHEYTRHRHDYPKTHFPGSTGDPEAPAVAAAATEDAAMMAPPTESMDLLSFGADAAPPAPAAPGGMAPTCDGMGALIPTQQPQQPSSSPYAADLLSFGAAPAPVPAEPVPPAAAAAGADAPMVPADGHVSFTTLTTGDDLATHEYDQHRHDYPKTHFPGSEGDPDASAVAAAAGVNPFDQFESAAAAPPQQGQQQQPPSGTSAGGGSSDLLGFP